MKYEHCMVDIETLSTETLAVVPSIGAVVFNLSDCDVAESFKTPALARRNFYIPLNIQEQLDAGRIVGAKTVQWWMKQSDDARAVFQEKAGPATTALHDFTRFCINHKVKYLWGNGNMFDNAILRSLYDSFKLVTYPVDFRSDMDLCTLRFAAGSPDYDAMGIPRDGIHHNALDDARHQVLQAQHYHQVIAGAA